jgi:formate hydrogenlyase subunit 3/multisubunit Na+/H+ antiporter MnhD subunit
MIAGVLIHQIGIRDMRKLGGLASRMPLTAGLAIIGAMGIAGLPGISGFISEYLIFLGAFSSSSSYKYILLILATLSTAISAGYMTLFIKRVFFGPLRDELKDATDPPYSMLIPMLILGVIAVILGIYPSLILDYVIPGLGFLMR